MTTERGERRAETNTVAAYLDALLAPKPKRNRAALVKRRSELEARLDGNQDTALERLRLVQAKLDVDADLARLDDAERIVELEDSFVKVGGGWARRGISAAALREVGVPAGVLKRAGF